MTASTPRRPPPKVKGQQKGARRINGPLAMDVETWTTEFGIKPKAGRAAIARRLVPFRRYGGRVILLRAEWEKFLAALPGDTAAEAIENVRAREAGR